MNDGKRNRGKTTELNLDCCGSVVRYLETPQDFFSVCLVFKGLIQYVEQYPDASRNVCFTVRSFPDAQKRYVSNVRFSRIAFPTFSKFLANYGCDEIDGILTKSFSAFPNLVRFNVEGMKYVKDEQIQQSGTLDLVDEKHESNGLSLSKIQCINLLLPSLKLNFDLSLQNLRRLILLNCDNVEFNSNEGYLYQKHFSRHTQHDLMIDWSKLPNLKFLCLFGWKVFFKNESLPSKNLQHLEHVELSRISTNLEDGINSFLNVKSLRKLDLSSPMSLIAVSSIRDLPQLRTIELSSEVDSFNHHISDISILPKQDKFSFSSIRRETFMKVPPITFQNLPNLVRVFIDFSDHVINYANGIMKCIDLPNLVYVEVNGVRSPIELINTPKLMIVKAFDCLTLDIMGSVPELGGVVFENTIMGNSLVRKFHDLELSNLFSFTYDIDRRHSHLYRDPYVSKNISLPQKFRFVQCIGLRTIKFSTFTKAVVEEVSDCINLITLHCTLNPDDNQPTILKESPFLGKLSIHLNSASLSKFLSNSSDVASLNHGLEYLSISGNSRSDIHLSCADLRMININKTFSVNNYRSLTISSSFTNQNKIEQLRIKKFVSLIASSIEINNLPFLETIEWIRKKEGYDGDIPKASIKITNCQQLWNLSLSSHGWTGEDQETDIHLENLPELVYLNLGNIACGIEKLVVRNIPNLENLEMSLSMNGVITDCDGDMIDEEDKPEFTVSSDVFPNLKSLTLHHKLKENMVEDEDGKKFSFSQFSFMVLNEGVMRIGLKGLKKLREIRLIGVNFSFSTFLRKVEDMNTSKIKVTLEKKVAPRDNDEEDEEDEDDYDGYDSSEDPMDRYIRNAIFGGYQEFSTLDDYVNFVENGLEDFESMFQKGLPGAL